MAGLKPWIVAARLRTLPLAISGVLVGTALAGNKVALDYSIFGLTLLTAILLQVLSNFANDFGDAVSGVDSDQRKGPERMVQSGAITKGEMKAALIVSALLTFLAGTLLLLGAFPGQWLTMLLFFILGLASIAAAIKYTVGKNPYGYAGFGDLFVFLFFGLVAVAGTYFLQTKSMELAILLPAASIGLFSVGVLNVNNIRDIESDSTSGKYSIPVRLGRKKAVIYHSVLLGMGVVCALVYTIIDYRSWAQLLFVPTLLLFVVNIKAVATKDSKALDPYLKQMAISTLLFSILFALGQPLSWFL